MYLQISDLNMIRCLQCLSPSLRNQRDVSRPHSDCPQTRIQSGDPILRHDLPQELVQGWVCVCVWTSAVSRCGVRSSAALCWLKSFSECFVTWLVFCFPGDNPNRSINPIITGAFGAVAGAASVFGNTPLDVIKTRMQVHAAHFHMISPITASEDVCHNQ